MPICSSYDQKLANFLNSFVSYVGQDWVRSGQSWVGLSCRAAEVMGWVVLGWDVLGCRLKGIKGKGTVSR